uniref:HSF-type DNA-binding domain-containing protein n=1 Tax=Myotis lucifugus TaxID=59463 RepID=G1Q304_MYOLU
YDTSPDFHVGPREALEGHGDQEESPDPSPQHNPQPPEPDQGTTNVEGNNISLGLSFPRKLWRIVVDAAFSSLCWNDDRDSMIIDENLFQRRGEEQIFESKSLKSFICLLNHHGFPKICPGNSSVCSARNRMMMHRTCNFQRGKPWFLENITTQGNQVMRVCPGISATPPNRKKKMAPRRHSSRPHHQNGGKEAEPKGKNDWGPNATQVFEFSVPQPMGSASPSASSGSSGEGTFGSVMFVPRATAGTNDTGDLPPPSLKPLQGSVMSLYKIYYSTLIAGLSDMTPSEDPDQAEEEQEGSSDNKCSVCERFKENAGP